MMFFRKAPGTATPWVTRFSLFCCTAWKKRKKAPTNKSTFLLFSLLKTFSSQPTRIEQKRRQTMQGGQHSDTGLFPLGASSLLASMGPTWAFLSRRQKKKVNETEDKTSRQRRAKYGRNPRPQNFWNKKYLEATGFFTDGDLNPEN